VSQPHRMLKFLRRYILFSDPDAVVLEVEPSSSEKRTKRRRVVESDDDSDSSTCAAKRAKVRFCEELWFNSSCTKGCLCMQRSWAEYRRSKPKCG
jgi:hypothetical protein